ncbi:MAG: alpha,alpha-trehalase TreA [Alphaproteobacteria bacterium]|nr:alpha,alpha-trehalase TreA [Alphaproteobacteria bacterium]MBU2084089.1 alpha,alpha-trehalase TreA [Alphaproteobacteria bacterium]MBU2144376.1 alpha,alpha-trehalase TreA [Alphaproteobacteria bacterium]MBU2196366.1 alpha,alpha-trehalase TreA [Alphaproteobacteria bacterium]
MTHFRIRRCVLALVLLASACSGTPYQSGETPSDTAPPSVLFGDLYTDAAKARIHPDTKTLADAVPRRAPADIVADYDRQKPMSETALRNFFDDNFRIDPPVKTVAPPEDLSLRDHIAALWPLLTRTTTAAEPGSSRLALPEPYVVPGGRFTEIYYWDSYFTMLGLGPDQAGLRRSMVNDFAYMIRTYGHVPNGSRTYYLSRSQPPFFYLMVSLLSPDDPAKAWAEYLPELKAEHDFWMASEADAAPGAPALRVVKLADGTVLNRYYDGRDVPRDESYGEDLAVAAGSSRPKAQVYRDIRAAAESGWDFSSRWFVDGKSLTTIHTTDILPPDLNSLLYGLEKAIAAGCVVADDPACAITYAAKADARRAAINTLLWNADTGLYDDLDWKTGILQGHVTAAGLYPLFTGAADDAKAAEVASATREHLLQQGGIVTSTINTGQQWDAPNGWAPLQWMSVTGLCRYDDVELARDIAQRWVSTVSRVYDDTGRLLEKYNVMDAVPGGGGEYALQDGFGWTNGVTLALMDTLNEPDGGSAGFTCPVVTGP